MKNFSLDKSYQQIDFDQVSVEELQVISGGSGGYTSSHYPGGIPGMPGPTTGLPFPTTGPTIFNPSYDHMRGTLMSIGSSFV